MAGGVDVKRQLLSSVIGIHILQNHGDTKQGIAYFVDSLSEGEFNQDELDDIADRIDFSSNRLRSVFMEFTLGERSVEEEDDLDDDAGDCAFEIGEAVERGDRSSVI